MNDVRISRKGILVGRINKDANRYTTQKKPDLNWEEELLADDARRLSTISGECRGSSRTTGLASKTGLLL